MDTVLTNHSIESSVSRTWKGTKQEEMQMMYKIHDGCVFITKLCIKSSQEGLNKKKIDRQTYIIYIPGKEHLKRS